MCDARIAPQWGVLSVVNPSSFALFLKGLAVSDVRCPHCGGMNESNAAFCGTCGTPLAVQTPPTPPNQFPSNAPQPSASNQPPPPGAYVPPPPGAIPAPPGVYPSPPGVYPPFPPGIRVLGQNTKWAIGLGIAALFCCGPFTAIPGLFLAKKDMDEFASGRAPQLNESSAKAAFYLNIIALILSAIGILFFWGRGFHGPF